MQLIPADILEQYSAVLKKRAVPFTRYADYRKWLRYYLDFLGKYTLPNSKSEHVRLFIQKLQEKKQTPEQQKQAAHALSLYFETLRRKDNKTPSARINTEKTAKATSPSTPFIKGENLLRTETGQRASSQPPDSGDLREASVPPPSAGNRFNEWGCLKKSASPAWDKVIDALAAEIKIRHYSRKTLKTYADWCRKFQSYLQNKHPDELSAADVKSYLTYLAVNCKVAASTQNQAFNALLFLFRRSCFAIFLKKISAITRTFPALRNRSISPWFFPERK